MHTTRRTAVGLIASFGTGTPMAQPKGPPDSAQRSLRKGDRIVVELASPTGGLMVVFEDDGETGYFYALDLTFTSQPIQEALHIYNVDKVTDSKPLSVLRIRWSEDGRKAGIWIDGVPQAVVDYDAKRGYCRTNFPPPGKWKSHTFEWSNDALRFFK